MLIEQRSTKGPKPLAANCAAVGLNNFNRNALSRENQGSWEEYSQRAKFASSD